MAKQLNLTDKLKNRDEKPQIVIGDTVLTVHNRAFDLIALSEFVEDKDGNFKASDVVQILDILFSEKDVEKIKKLDLDIDDLNCIVEAAADLLVGATKDKDAPKN